MVTFGLKCSAQLLWNDKDYCSDKTRFGLIAGAQASVVAKLHGGSEIRLPGLVIGGLAQIPLQRKTRCNLFFAPSLIYSQEGENSKTGTTKVNFHHDYLAAPLMFKAYVGTSRLLFFELGPKVGYLLSQANKMLDIGEPDLFDLAISAGGGLSFGSNNSFELSGRLNWGITDRYPESKDTNNGVAATVLLTYLF